MGKWDANEATTEANAYYYHAKFDHSLQSSVMDKEKYMQTHELIKRLAKIAHKQMDPKPALEEIEQALTTLMGHQLDVPNKAKPGEKRKMPALAFSREGDVMVAEHLIKHYDKARLKSCLRDVLCHEHTNKKNLLYGRCDERLPFVWNVMNIEPKKGVKLLMERPSYFSPELIAATRGSLKTVSFSSKADPDPQGMQVEDLSRAAFDSHFSDTAHKNVDMDLDEYAARKHADKIGLVYLYPRPPIDAPNWNVSPLSFTEAEMKSMGARKLFKLKSYPRNIPERNKFECQAAIAKDVRENPKKYSLKAHCETFLAGNKRSAADAGLDGDDFEVVAAAADAASAAAAAYDTEMKDTEEKDEEKEEPLYNPENFCDDAEFSDGEQDDDPLARPSQRANVGWAAFSDGCAASAAAGSAAANRGSSRYNDGSGLTEDDWAQVAAGH